MDKKSDLRTIQTKESIKKALYKLAEDKSFDEISVTDITKSYDKQKHLLSALQRQGGSASVSLR